MHGDTMLLPGEESPWPRIKRSDLPAEVQRWFAPIKSAVGFLEQGSICGKTVILWRDRQFTSTVGGKRLNKKLRSENTKARRKAAAGFISLNRGTMLSDDGACVEAGIHFHDCDASILIAVKDGGRDRGGAAPAGKQGCMNIDAAVRRQLKDPGGQDMAVCSDDDNIRAE